MNQSYLPDDVGYLIVKVSTAQGVIPLENATVNIRASTPDSSTILFSLRTNRDGQTEKLALQTPPRSASATPDSGVIPYALYNIDVFKENYVPLFFQNVPIFPTITSIQPAVMVPLPNLSELTEPHSPSTVIPQPDQADL